MRPLPGSITLLPQDKIHNDLRWCLDLLFDGKPNKDLFNPLWKNVNSAAGFKIMAHQIQGLANEEFFWNELKSRKVKVILAFRYNILKQYVSDLITLATGQSACWKGAIKTAKVVVPTSSLKMALDNINAQKLYLINKVAEYDLDKVRLRYEDYCDDFSKVANILPWLANTSGILTTKLHRQNPVNLKDRVYNYDELVAYATALGFKNLLD
jgi:hypothetical protein